MQYDLSKQNDCMSCYAISKPIHPKVMNTLLRIKAPSPCRIVSDDYQPKSGHLKAKILTFPIKIEKVCNEATKKEVFLNLQRNSILNRRPTREC